MRLAIFASLCPKCSWACTRLPCTSCKAPAHHSFTLYYFSLHCQQWRIMRVVSIPDNSSPAIERREEMHRLAFYLVRQSRKATKAVSTSVAVPMRSRPRTFSARKLLRRVCALLTF
eukprot:6182179-Pleurochrysis_carterae.AAC.2